LPVVVRAIDKNRLGYVGVSLRATTNPGGNVDPSLLSTDENGQAAFRWTPPPAQRSLTLSIDSTTTSTKVGVGGPPLVLSVVNAASFTPRLASGGFATIFGEGLAKSQVLLGDTPAPAISTSDSQINFLIPSNVTGSVDLVARDTVSSSAPVRVSLNAYAPAIFFDSASGYGAVLLANTASLTQTRPPNPGDYLEVYCTGLGAADQPVSATLAGLPAQVTYQGVTSIPGLYQVNLRVPSGAASGKQQLSISIAGTTSNTVAVQLASQ
jgi:uncharacterized protein (TIGR03437 family)